jgi:hypothetical protein
MKYFIVFALVLVFAFPSFAGGPKSSSSSHHNWLGWMHFWDKNKSGPGCTHVQHAPKKFGGKPVITCEQAEHSR